jgi:hypothetical protein
VQTLLTELGVLQSTTAILWFDNIGAIYVSINLMFYTRIKHIEVDYHFVLYKVSQKLLYIPFIPHLVDDFTKSLATRWLEVFCLILIT